MYNDGLEDCACPEGDRSSQIPLQRIVRIKENIKHWSFQDNALISLQGLEQSERETPGIRVRKQTCGAARNLAPDMATARPTASHTVALLRVRERSNRLEACCVYRLGRIASELLWHSPMRYLRIGCGLDVRSQSIDSRRRGNLARKRPPQAFTYSRASALPNATCRSVGRGQGSVQQKKNCVIFPNAKLRAHSKKKECAFSEDHHAQRGARSRILGRRPTRQQGRLSTGRTSIGAEPCRSSEPSTPQQGRGVESRTVKSV
ncbi:hypothetical protein DFH11DRAFT_1543464 [Phellopilus nigrolimitatus]|nr:hypothetical protein DFH11DRAFT_1543464 [Phellopilus nigrolimitatus]